MSGRCARPGFTLLEMLSASVLLGLMVTLLTLLFRQGTIASGAGKASVSDAAARRREIARAARVASETLVCADGSPRLLLSAWDENGKVRETRPLARADAPLPKVGTACREVRIADEVVASGEILTVVVSSAGPDGKWGTADDLTTDVPEVDE